jgi:CRISPR-associated protein Cmr5
MQTLSQKRAEFALQRVLDATDVKRFKPFSAGAASVILQNGFGQAMAFWYSKKQKEHKIMTDLIEEWIRRQYRRNFGDDKDQDPKAFLQALMHLDQENYHSIQQETVQLLEWVKRFANAFIQEDRNDNPRA